ncbi:MAG: TonB-dependent receptor [Spirochaetia bacterium]|nr:TonB-dependent receptor [Spirochaetia bacterium]
MKNKIITYLLFLFLFFLSINIYAQEAITISGKIIYSESEKPAVFVTVAILETKQKTRTDSEGRYAITLNSSGEYTILVSSNAIENYMEKINIITNLEKNIFVSAVKISGQKLTIIGERDIQKISRNTLDQKAIKDAPATFGDSLNALTTLPGVIRSGGFLGSLIIRGAPDTSNRYFIDDIPVLNPQHFGSIQSVISNDLINKIDLYSSAHPASFDGAFGAVIDIQTVDSVKKPKNVLDVSIISSNFYTAFPISRNRDENKINVSEEKENENKFEKEKAKNGDKNTAKPLGYWIAAARISYLTLLVPPISKFFSDEGITQLPEYYDYQLKGKLFADERGKHSFSALFFGSYDTFVFTQELNEEEKKEAREEGSDPLLDNSEGNTTTHSHSQSIRYMYRPSEKYYNKTILFNIYNHSIFKIKAQGVIDAGLNRTQDIESDPSIAGIINKNSYKYFNSIFELETSLAYRLYYFQSKGETVVLTRPDYASNGPPDFADDSLFANVDLNRKASNHLISAHLVHKIKYKKLTLAPGIRSDYLLRTKDITFDPRGFLSYEFESGTTLSAAGGIYHSFAQINQFLYNRAFSQQPQVIEADYIKPEKAVHQSAGIEQKYDLYTLKIEGFYNTFSDLLENYPRPAEDKYFINTTSAKAQGFEIFIKKDRFAETDGLYSWISYTYTHAKFKTGSPLDTNRGQWLPARYEQPHNLKITAGYIFGRNQIGARFEMSSGFPYTPIISSDEKLPGRYSPIYGIPLSERYNLSHRLDIRYSQDIKFTKSTLKWYIEFINVYNYKPDSSQKWSYTKPFEKNSNPILTSSNPLGIIPNFGLEYRF